MSKLCPLYAKNIIVAVLYHASLKWYISDSELWFMDLTKRSQAFQDQGYTIYADEIDELRRDCLILDTNNIAAFLSQISDYEISTSELRQLFQEALQKSQCAINDFVPALYLDFDQKIFYSWFPEPIFYEKFVPNGWVAKYKNFLNNISDNARYWILNGQNYLEKGEVNNEKDNYYDE